MAAGRQGCATVEHPDIIEAEEAALEDVFPIGVLAIDPPGKIQEQFMEDPLQEHTIPNTLSLLFNLVDAPGSPSMDRWIHIAESPFVGGNLSVRMHVPLTQHEHELFLGKGRIDERERNTVKRKIPGGVPGVLPLVRH